MFFFNKYLVNGQNVHTVTINTKTNAKPGNANFGQFTISSKRAPNRLSTVPQFWKTVIKHRRAQMKVTGAYIKAYTCTR